MPTTETRTTCAHCGTPFLPRATERYCCHGCAYVAQLLEAQELTHFYDLKGTQRLPPVGSKAFATIDPEPLRATVAQAEAKTESPVGSARFNLEGISCIGCVWLIESIYQRQQGSARLRIDARAGVVELHWQRGHFDIAHFAGELQKIGYRLSPYSEDAAARSGRHAITHRLGLCGFFLMNTMLFTLPGYLGMGGEFFLAPLFQLLGAAFATLSLIVGGGYFVQRAWQAARNRVLHIDLPIAAGLIAGYLGSLVGWATGTLNLIYFDFVATFVFLMLAGRWLQEFALDKNRSHLQRRKAGPRTVTHLGGAADGQTVPVEEVSAGMCYSLRPGEINPVAADPLDGEGTLSLEWINGEPEPVIWPQTRITPAGAINVGLGPLRFRARESWANSLLAHLLERPEDNFQERRLQSVLKLYIAVVLAVATLGGAAWMALTGNPLMATQVLISVLIVSCPCALGIALPMCDEFAIARLRRAGLFVKSAQIWERLRQIRSVVFDKTGTLTMDIPKLRNPQAVAELDPLAAEALGHMVEGNRHPVARALREALLAAYPLLHEDGAATAQTSPSGGVLARSPAVIEETIGQGVAWSDAGGNRWTLGKPHWRCGNSVDNAERQRTHTVLRQNGLLVAEFDFQEDVRDDAREAVNSLTARGLATVILSGDTAERVMPIARQLGLEAEAASSPQDKADWIEQHAPAQALMIGDGANDSLAFDRAICRGTPVVDASILEARADFFFFGRSLQSLPLLFKIARQRRHTVSLIFVFAVIYNITAVGVCLAGLMHPLLAAIVMPLSSLATLAMAWLGLGRFEASGPPG